MKFLNLILTLAVLFLFAGVQATSAQTKETKPVVKTEKKVEKKEMKEMKPVVKTENKIAKKETKSAMISATKEAKSKVKAAKVASTKEVKAKAKVKAHHMKHKTEKAAAETPSK